MIDFACPQCGHDFRVPDSAAGKSGKCKSCGESVTVPHQGTLIGREPIQLPQQFVPQLPRQFVPQPPEPLTFTAYASPVSVTVTNNHPHPSSGIAIAGMILGLFGILICWMPFFSLPIAFLGMLLSLVGLFKRGEGVGYALAGVLLNGLTLMLLVTIGTLIAVGLANKIDQDVRRAAPAIPQNERPRRKRPQPIDHEPQPAARDEAPAQPEEVPLAAMPVVDLPEIAIAKKQFPGEPFYVRARITPGVHSENELTRAAEQLLERLRQPNGVVDYFETSGPLQWSGTMVMKNATTQNHWLCRVTVMGGSAPNFEFGRNSKDKERTDAVRGE